MYDVRFSKKADKDIKALFKVGNKTLLIKLGNILKEMRQHPYEGIGRPEELKYNLSGFWSRRLDKQNRIIYKVFDDVVEVLIISAKGHYNDK